MKIGFDAKRATHNFRGLGNYARGLIEGLLEYSPSEELFIYTPPIKDPRGIDWVKSILKSSNIHIENPDQFITKKIPSLWRSFFIESNLKRDNLDLFHGLSHEIPFGLGVTEYKKVVTMHDLIFMRYPEFFPWHDRLVYAQKFSYACKHSDMVIAICEQTKNDLIQYLDVDEKKIKVHYQSCSPLFYQQHSSESIQQIKLKYKITNPFVIHVGAFEPRKNQLLTLEAYASIVSKIEEDLVFVGNGKAYFDQVARRIKELHLEDRVHLLNHVSHADLPYLYQAASAFCFPSLFEGFGIPIIEALFSKTPVITSFGSCFPESAGPDSYFIDPQSESSIANGLLAVLSDKNLQNSMKEKGYKFVQRFHRNESSQALLECYRQVLK